jgi:ribosome assembly protein 1
MFGRSYAKKLGVKPQLLQRTLWGEFYFSPKAKRIYTKARGDLQPMFVQFCLRNIWEVYAAVNSSNWEKIDKIVKALQLNLQFKESQKKDTRKTKKLL